MTFRDRLKKTKDKGGDAFASLKRKFPKGSVFGKKVKPPKKDLLEGMVDTSGFYKNIAEEHGKAEYGRGGKELSIFDKMKGGFGKAKKKYSDWDKKRSEEARIKKYATVRKCRKCGQMHTEAEPCPKGPSPQQKEEAMERIRAEHSGGGEKKKKFELSGYGPLIASICGLGFSLFFGMPLVAIIVFAALIALAVISISLFHWLRWPVTFLFVIALIALFVTGQFKKFADVQQVAVAYAQIEETIDTIKEEATKIWKTINCYRLVTPALVDACLKELEEEEKEGGEYFEQKEYETLEIKPGNPFKDFQQASPPNSGEFYDWEVTLINRNEKIFNITVTNVTAWTTYLDSEEKYIIYANELPVEIPYNLLPNEPDKPNEPDNNLFLMIPFPADKEDCDKCLFTNCDSKTFRMNVTSRHKGGTDSWFGIAPNDDNLKWQRFIQGYDPDYQPDPGPLDIFAFIYPFGIDQSYYKQYPLKVKLIIKLRNPKTDGTIFIDEFHFSQNFKFSKMYFNISPDSCIPWPKLGDVNILYERDTDLCADYSDHNCLHVTFSPPLEISKDEVKVLKCNVTINDIPLSDVYEDFMRVYASYDFLQEYEQTLTCIGVKTGEDIDSETTSACRCNIVNDNCESGNCEGCIICKDEDSQGVCNYGVWYNAESGQAPCCENLDCEVFCTQIYPDASCYYTNSPACDPIDKECNQIGILPKLCGSTIQECEQLCPDDCPP